MAPAESVAPSVMVKAATPLASSPTTPTDTPPEGLALTAPATAASKYEPRATDAIAVPRPAASLAVMNAPAVSAITPSPSTATDFMVSPREM